MPRGRVCVLGGPSRGKSLGISFLFSLLLHRGEPFLDAETKQQVSERVLSSLGMDVSSEDTSGSLSNLLLHACFGLLHEYMWTYCVCVCVCV